MQRIMQLLNDVWRLGSMVSDFQQLEPGLWLMYVCVCNNSASRQARRYDVSGGA